MAETRVVIDVDINTSPAATALKSLQSQINSFTTALNRNNTEQALASKGITRQLMDLVNTSKYFTAEMVRMQTGASQLDKTLSKGQVTMSQFFGAKFRKDGLEAARVLSLANARAQALQTQFIATSGAANGFRDAIAIKPLAAFNDAAAVSAQRLIIQRAMLQQATTSMINFGKNTQWAGRQLMVGFTVPLTIFAATAGKTFMDLEKQSLAFKKVYGDAFTTPEELNKNIEAVKQLSAEFTKYGIAVSDTMGLAAQAAAAGAKNADLIDATTEATRLATLGQLDLQAALETTISLQSAFGLSGDRLAKSINFMNMVENQTVLTLQDLTDAIPRVAPVIQGLGGTVEDMAIMLTAMKEGGVSAAQGANALKSGLASLINPTDRAVEKLQKMGVNLNAIVQTNRGDLMGTVQDFGKALATLDEFQRQQALETVFGKFQYARLGALFNNIVRDGSQASRAMDAAAMSAEGLAATASKELKMIEESPATKFTAAMEKLKLAIAPIGEMFVKMATPIINFFSALAEKFNNLPDFAKNFLALGTVITGIVIPAGTMFLGLLMNLIGTLTKFGHLATIFVKGFAQGGIRQALQNVTQATKYMGLAEMDAANAAQQLSSATQSVNAALLEQVGPTEAATAAISGLSGAYDILVQNMREAQLVGGLPMQVPGAAMMRGTGSIVGRPLPIVRRNRGGSIPYMSTGSTVPGIGNTDTVPAMLTPGEFVVNKQATRQNIGLLHAINNGDVQYRNKGGGIAQAGRMFYGVPPINAAGARATLQAFQSSRQAIADIWGLPATAVARQRATSLESQGIQTQATRAARQTEAQIAWQAMLAKRTKDNQKLKSVRLAEFLMNLSKNPLTIEELNLKRLGNYVFDMSQSSNIAAQKGTLTRQALLNEIANKRAVYRPLDQQLQSYFGRQLDYDLFDRIYREKIGILPASGINNKQFEVASRRALTDYLNQAGYSREQRKSFIADILAKDLVRGNVSEGRILSLLRENNIATIPGTKRGELYIDINGERFNVASLSGKKFGTILDAKTRKGIRLFETLSKRTGTEFSRVHANKGGQILGGMVDRGRNFYGRFNAKTIELFTKWVSSQPSAISEMKMGVAKDAALAQMFKGGFRKSKNAETLERATWMENLPKLGSTMPLGSLASFSPKGTPVTQHLMDSQLRKDYESAMMFLKMDQKTQKQDAYFLRKVMQAGPDNVPSWSPEHRYISPITKKKGIDAWVEDTVKFMSDRKRQIKKHKEVIRNYHRMIPTIVELDTPVGTIRANVDDIVALQNQKFMGRQTTEQERILHNAMIKVLGIEEEGNLKRVKAKLISSEYPGFNSGGVIPKMQYFGANMLQRVVQPMVAAKTAAQQQEFLTLYSGGNFEKGFALNPIKTRANTTNLHGPGVYTTEAKNMAETYVVNRGNNDRHLYEMKVGKGTRKFLDLDQEYIDAPTFKIEMAMEKVLKKHGMTYEDVMPLRTGSMTVAQWRESITENIASKLKARGMSRDDAEWEGQMAFVNAARESGISGLTHVGGKLMGKNEQLHRVYILYDKPDSMLKLNQGGFLSPTLRANRGNIVPGTGNTDTVPAMLTPGEFVVNKKATQQNIDILHAINNGNVPGYALGGQVRSINSGQLDRNGKPIRYYQAKMPDGSRQYFATRAEANSAIKSARPPGMMGMGKMNVSMGLGMGGMGIMMIGQKMESDAMQRGTTSAMGSALSMGGLGLSIASILPMMGKFGIALGAVAAVVGPIAVSLKIFRENIDKAAQESLKLGQNTGGTANRMEELSAATGYQFSITRAQDRIFRFTEQEKQNAQQFVGYFESEGGQKFINDLKSLTSNDRYEKVASIIAQGIADGMDEETAKAYGNAIAAYVNDGMLRSRLIQDFRRGKFKSGPQALVDLVVKRQEDSQAAIDKLAGKTGYSSVAGGPLGNTAEGIRNKQVGLGAIGGIGGAIGGGVIGGAIAGAAAGSVVPVIGTLIGAAIGTAIGLGAAWLLNKSAVQQLEQNTRLAGVSLGSSLESLKEIANAEAAISEARLNGTMKAQEAEIELAKLRKTEAAAATNVKNAVEAMATGSVDTDAMGLALKNSLLLNANFDEAKAQAVVDSTAFNTVATQLFSNIDPEKIKTDPEYKKQKEVVLSIITETLTGITPENAAQKIADIEQIYATVQNQLVSAAADGLTPDELRTIASARGLSNVFSTAWKGLIDEVIPPTVTKDQLVGMLVGRAQGIFGKGTIGGEERRRGGYLGTTVVSNLKEISSDANKKTFQDIETGTKIIGETQAKATSELGKIFTEGVLRAAPGGYKSFEELLLNANEGGDYEKAQVLSTIASVAESPEQFASLLSQMMLVNEEFASFINSSEGMSSLSYNLQNLGIDAQQFAADLRVINAGLNVGIANPKIIKVDTPIEKASKAIEAWYNKSKPQLEAMGITAQILESNLLAISDPALITRLGAVGALGDQARMNYAKLIQLLPKGLDVNAVAAAYPDALTDAKTVANELQQALEDIDKIEFKKFGKNWKEVKTAIGRIDKTTFANLAISAGYARKEIAPLFEDIASGYDSVADSIAKTKGLVSKETGNVKTSKITGEIVQEVYFSMYGKNIDDPNQLVKDIQSYFPSQLSPIMLPIIMAVMEAGISPAEFGAAMKGQKTFKGQTTVSDAGTRRYGIGPETVTTTQVVGQQAVDYAAWANSISSMFSGAAGTGPGGGGGGGGEKSIIEQLKEQFRLLEDIFDGFAKNISQKTGLFKGIAAGPFGEEFINFLISQGEKGIKILKEKGDKFNKAYQAFLNVQMQTAKNYMQQLPAIFSEQRLDLVGQSAITQELIKQNFSQANIDAIMEGLPEGYAASYAKAKAKPKKKRTEEEQTIVDMFKPENVKKALKQANRLNAQVREDFIKTKEDALGLETTLKDALAGKNISPEVIDMLTEMGWTSAQVKSNLGQVTAEAQRLDAVIKASAYRDSMQEMADETTQLNNAMTLMGQNIAPEAALAISQIAGSATWSTNQINAFAESFKKLEILRLAAQDPEQLKLQQMQGSDRIKQLKYEIALIEEVNKDEKMSALYLKENVTNSEDLLEVYERRNTAKAREIELKQRELEPIDKQISLYEEQIETINDSYDLQMKALDDIYEKEDQLAQLRQGRLDVASALSRGDIGAAAQAALQLQRSMSEQRQANTQKAIEQARQEEIEAVETKITAEKDKRKVIEDEIVRLQGEQRDIQDQIYNVQFIINEQAARLEDLYQLGNDKVSQLKSELSLAEAEQRKLNDAIAEGSRLRGAATTTTVAIPTAALAQTSAVEQAYFDSIYNDPTIKEIRENLDALDWSQYMAFGGKVNYRGSREPAPGMMIGGRVKKFATGAFVPGRGMTDKVPAMLTPGEFVVRKSVAQQYGPLLENLNGQIYPKLGSTGASKINFSQPDFSSSIRPADVKFNVPPNIFSNMYPQSNVFGTESNVSSDITNYVSGPTTVQYNYNLNVSTSSNSSPDDIANAIMYKIKRIEDRNIRGTQVG